MVNEVTALGGFRGYPRDLAVESVERTTDQDGDGGEEQEVGPVERKQQPSDDREGERCERYVVRVDVAEPLRSGGEYLVCFATVTV